MLKTILPKYIRICCLAILFLSVPVVAKESCYSDMREVLGCFLAHNDKVYQYNFIEEDNSSHKITKKTYLLSSQRWPVGNYKDMPSTIWQHKLTIYIPKEMTHSKALLFVGGGRNRNIEGKQEWLLTHEKLDFAKIASANKAPVVTLLMAPNQFLFFNGKPYKEDQILAYTYKRFMDDPFKNAYLVGHLPMAKSIIKGMDAVQDIFLQEGISIDGFVLSGVSKRGWAVWLAALGDDRIDAIIPINIDVLNARQSMFHTCKSHGTCPPALRDYEVYGISQIIKNNDPLFAQLMAVEDPYSYLQEGYDEKYKERLSIPKYIINSSSDDFFVPDSSRWYFKKLPGDNQLRCLPNAMHYFAGDSISDATDSLRLIAESLSTYFYFILNKVELPKISWKFDKDKIHIDSSIPPFRVKLWVAHNKDKRDFRFLSSYSKLHLLRKKLLTYVTKNICDNCYKPQNVSSISICRPNAECSLDIDLPSFRKGWQASFVELHYNIDGLDFVVTTEVDVVPDLFPDRRGVGVDGEL